VGPRAGLDDVEKRKFLNLPGLELRPFGRPARSQSPYRLRYPGSYRDLKCLLRPLIKEAEVKMCPLYVRSPTPRGHTFPCEVCFTLKLRTASWKTPVSVTTQPLNRRPATATLQQPSKANSDLRVPPAALYTLTCKWSISMLILCSTAVTI
jgi:hypothetical protein